MHVGKDDKPVEEQKGNTNQKAPTTTAEKKPVVVS